MSSHNINAVYVHATAQTKKSNLCFPDFTQCIRQMGFIEFIVLDLRSFASVIQSLIIFFKGNVV